MFTRNKMFSLCKKIKYFSLIVSCFSATVTNGDQTRRHEKQNHGIIIRMTESGLQFAQNQIISATLFTCFTDNETKPITMPFIRVSSPTTGFGLATELRNFTIMDMEINPVFKNTFLPPNKINVVISDVVLKSGGELVISSIGSMLFNCTVRVQLVDLTLELFSTIQGTPQIDIVDCYSTVQVENMTFDNDGELYRNIVEPSSDSIGHFLCKKIISSTRELLSTLDYNPVIALSDFLEIPLEQEINFNTQLTMVSKVTNHSVDFHIAGNFQNVDEVFPTDNQEIHLPEKTHRMFAIYISSYPLNQLGKLIQTQNMTFIISNSSHLEPCCRYCKTCVGYMFPYQNGGGRDPAERFEMDVSTPAAPIQFFFTPEGDILLSYNTTTKWYSIHTNSTDRKHLATIQVWSNPMTRFRLNVTGNNMTVHVSLTNPLPRREKVERKTRLYFFRQTYRKAFKRIQHDLNTKQFQLPSFLGFNVDAAKTVMMESIYELSFNLVETKNK